MVQIDVDISGLEDLSRALVRAPQETVNALGSAIQKSAYIVKQLAMAEAPVAHRPGGGYLRQHITAEMTGRASASVTATAPYAAYVERGTRPHIIRPVEKRVLAADARFSNWPVVRNGYAIFGTLVHHPGTKPNPFMARAVEKAAPRIAAVFADAVLQIARLFR